MAKIVTFYHDIEQNIDSTADPKICMEMVKEFLNLEKKYNIPVTYNVVGKLFKEQPDLIKQITEAGQEVAFHSYNHQPDWNPRYYSNEIDLCKKVSSLPLGYRSPRSKWNGITLRKLREQGFLWSAEGGANKEPYFIYKDLVRLPISGDDWPLQTGAMNIEKWVEQFRGLLEERLYVAFGSHDSVTSFSPEERLRAWEMVLRVAVESKVLCVTFSEAADLYRRAAQEKGIKAPYRNLENKTATGRRVIPVSAVNFDFLSRWYVSINRWFFTTKRKLLRFRHTKSE